MLKISHGIHPGVWGRPKKSRIFTRSNYRKNGAASPSPISVLEGCRSSAAEAGVDLAGERKKTTTSHPIRFPYLFHGLVFLVSLSTFCSI